LGQESMQHFSGDRIVVNDQNLHGIRLVADTGTRNVRCFLK